ncbi:unnamed protein product [Didymodactylos carnosus]|uniref:Integrase catalytic domain-containing protein n=1 Tax=Didymodactylos carnosus TaxID=1234261 RepID=A0A815HGW0_9BILA|nr:unnamed protein product [Didymodactylos carnosus]CAF1352013.1 unnamed protein product [Didymodactylos carnosus]CAF3836483.1 unnamed protein product [Didymodactylos carnosus]CAF4222833.1 unnamed protein product [Didymodactylos carnosus]
MTSSIPLMGATTQEIARPPDNANSGSSPSIVNGRPDEQDIKILVHDEQLFDCINDEHCRIDHGGRTRTFKEIQKKYSNITKQQVDLIDFQSKPDGEYKFLMNYQDHFNKFTVLRPLKNKTAVEVGRELVNIFSLFGAPTILQSDNGREFVNHIIDSLAELWPGLKIVHEKPRHPQSQGSVEKCNHDIETKLTVWMQEHRNAKWTEGVPIAMYQKNTSFHSRLKMTPYEAFFGRAASLGLSDSHLKDDDTNENCPVEAGDNQPSSDITTNPSLTVQAKCHHKVASESTRSVVDANQEASAAKMIDDSDRHLPLVTLGDNVRVPVPLMDRSRADPPNVLGLIITEINGMYKIGCRGGTIKRLYAHNQFKKYDSKILKIVDIDLEGRSLRNIVENECVLGGQKNS